MPARGSSWRSLLRQAEQRLAARVHSPAACDATAEGHARARGNLAAEARWIIEEASGLQGAALAAYLDERATTRGIARVDAMVERRAAGEPLQYVLGHWPFRGLDLLVDQRVLIPRPETEAVCDIALGELDRVAGLLKTAGAPEQAAAPDMPVVDLGTGTGALALAIATERPTTEVWAVERSPGAVAVARANLAALGGRGRRVHLLEGSWFEPLPDELRGQVQLLVSNPPYVGSDEPLPDAVARWEPREAFRPNPMATGLESIEAIITGAPTWLAATGVVVLEIGETQGPAVEALARAAGFTSVDVRPDLSGRPRALVARGHGA